MRHSFKIPVFLLILSLSGVLYISTTRSFSKTFPAENFVQEKFSVTCMSEVLLLSSFGLANIRKEEICEEEFEEKDRSL